MFQEVSRNFRMQAEGQELRLVTRPTHLWVHTDRTMLARILNNLVSNALRYTHEGGVLVGARKRGDQVSIDVCDTGVGIADEHQAHIFEEFYRIDDDHHRHFADRDAHRGQRGLGLGLSTVKRLTELLDAQCHLTSSPGRGSTFTLMVLGSRQPVESAARSPGISLDTLQSHDFDGQRVLMIEDDRAILAGMYDLLRKWGFTVHTATDCMTALEQATDMPAPPDIVISDLHLGGGCDGVQAMHKLAERFHASADDPPFACLLITGETEHGRLAKARASGIPILFKPVSASALREAILRLLPPHPAPETHATSSRATSDT